MNYTISQFKKDFFNDDVCLDYLFNTRFGGRDYICPLCDKAGFYRIKARKVYTCSHCGHQVSPTAGTIFHKSRTSLTNWFFVVYLMSKSKHGVSAKEIQRHLGCTYKCAWRIGKQIRSLMKPDNDKLEGTIEADEMYVGGKRRFKDKNLNKVPVMGMVQRGGKVKSKVILNAQTHTLLNALSDNVKFGSRVITDDNSAYKPDKVKRIGMFHDTICHSKGKYVEGDIYTNSIESHWSRVKNSIRGCHIWVSRQHLQSYLDFFSYHHNQRYSSVPVFFDLLSRLCGQPYSEGQKTPSFVDIPVS